MKKREEQTCAEDCINNFRWWVWLYRDSTIELSLSYLMLSLDLRHFWIMKIRFRIKSPSLGFEPNTFWFWKTRTTTLTTRPQKLLEISAKSQVMLIENKKEQKLMPASQRGFFILLTIRIYLELLGIILKHINILSFPFRKHGPSASQNKDLEGL